uniref:Uncharacterized protein n=1 Tax=Avena sativa TaxID=4498 RepID=A0ACD5X0S9_AVESA
MPSLSGASATTASPAAASVRMPRVGDPANRPMEGYVVIASTPAMEAEATRLANHAAVIRLGGNMPRVNAATIIDAINSHTGTPKNYIRVVPGYPDDFIATFHYQHHLDKLTALPGRFSYERLDIHVSNWRLNAHAEVKDHYYHVHLSIENVPLNCWTDDVATRLLGPATVLHYFDIPSLLKEDVSVISLWAWSSDPNSIPKIQWLTITDNPTAGLGGTTASTVTGRRGLRRRALVHLDMLEDFTPGPDGAIPSRSHTSEPTPYRLGVVDGERHIRDRPRSPPPVRHCNDDDDRRRMQDRDRRDDDDDRGRHGRDGHRDGQRSGLSWRQRLFRSRSRAPDQRRHDDREDRRRDDGGRRDGGRDDGRRRGDYGTDARTADLSRVQRLPSGQVIPASGCRRRGLSPEPCPRPSRSSSLDTSSFGRGRSPLGSPRVVARLLMAETSFTHRPFWIKTMLPCFTTPVRSIALEDFPWVQSAPSLDGEAGVLASAILMPTTSQGQDLDEGASLPPPPPLPRDGPRPTRLFSLPLSHQSPQATRRHLFWASARLRLPLR